GPVQAKGGGEADQGDMQPDRQFLTADKTCVEHIAQADSGKDGQEKNGKQHSRKPAEPGLNPIGSPPGPTARRTAEGRAAACKAMRTHGNSIARSSTGGAFSTSPLSSMKSPKRW